MTRVLMTADTVGGVWTYALELADALSAYGVEVHLATMGRRMSAGQRAAAELSAVAEVHESDFALEWQPHPWADVERAGDWLLELESAVRPDLVHLNGYVHAVLPWRAPVVVVGHSDVLSWWHAVRGGPAPPEWATYRERVAAGLAAADAVVAPTRVMLRALARWYGCDHGVVIPNCRCNEWVRVVDKEPLVLGSGRVWDEAKNLSLLDQIAPRLPWPVVIVGDAADGGNGADGADGMAARRRSGATTFLGELPFPRLAAELLRASVFVLPAKYEPFGLGPLEAAHAECALVLGDIPSLREVWDDAAVFVDPDDPDGLTRALVRLAENPRERRAMGDRARRHASRYRPDRTARAYLDVYRRLPVRTGGTR